MADKMTADPVVVPCQHCGKDTAVSAFKSLLDMGAQYISENRDLRSQLTAATARAERAEKALAESQDGKYRFFVWTDHASYLAVAHARSVEEARQALEDNDLGGLDGSCPERAKARKVIYSETPAIYYGKNAEFCVIGIDGQEELEAKLEKAEARLAEYDGIQAEESERPEPAELVKCGTFQAPPAELLNTTDGGTVEAIRVGKKYFRELRADLTALADQNAALRAALEEVEALMDASTGVAGLHLNGNVAEWDELLEGGACEGWLLHFRSALALTPPAALAAAREREAGLVAQVERLMSAMRLIQDRTKEIGTDNELGICAIATCAIEDCSTHTPAALEQLRARERSKVLSEVMALLDGQFSKEQHGEARGALWSAMKTVGNLRADAIKARRESEVK